jgi:phospholipase/carboxylesterase
LGERSVESLQELGISAQWHTYPMAHEVSLESLSLLGEWITQTITS